MSDVGHMTHHDLLTLSQVERLLLPPDEITDHTYDEVYELYARLKLMYCQHRTLDRHKLEELQRTVETLQKKLDNHIERYDNLRTRYDDRGDRIDILNNRIYDLETKIHELHTHNTQMRTELLSRDAQIAELTTALRSRDTQISAFMTALQCRDAKIKTLEQELADQQRNAKEWHSAWEMMLDKYQQQHNTKAPSPR